MLIQCCGSFVLGVGLFLTYPPLFFSGVILPFSCADFPEKFSHRLNDPICFIRVNGCVCVFSFWPFVIQCLTFFSHSPFFPSCDSGDNVREYLLDRKSLFSPKKLTVLRWLLALLRQSNTFFSLSIFSGESPLFDGQLQMVAPSQRQGEREEKTKRNLKKKQQTNRNHDFFRETAERAFPCPAMDTRKAEKTATFRGFKLRAT